MLPQDRISANITTRVVTLVVRTYVLPAFDSLAHTSAPLRFQVSMYVCTVHVAREQEQCCEASLTVLVYHVLVTGELVQKILLSCFLSISSAGIGQVHSFCIEYESLSTITGSLNGQQRCGSKIHQLHRTYLLLW